jgi:hypothetical protein
MTREHWRQMTPEQQRIKVAELCGLAPFVRRDGSASTTGLPDYLDDLNAMHEAEQIFHTPRRSGVIPKYVYETHLLTITKGEPIYATAAQRAEAFVLTMDKGDL